MKPYRVWIDELDELEKIVAFDHHCLLAAMRRAGLPVKTGMSFGEIKCYVDYALRRSRSNHPHNAKWRVVGDLFIAAQVAAKLREDL